MITGEYFLGEKAKENAEKEKKREAKAAKKQEKVEAKLRDLQAPEEVVPEVVVQATEQKKSSKPDIDALKKKFLKKK